MKAASRVRFFTHVVDAQGAADALAAALRTSRRGRPQQGSPRTFLILLLLAAADGELTIERMHHIATRELPRDVQLELGTVRRRGDQLVDMPIAELYYMSRTITKKLSWTGLCAEPHRQAERQRRQEAMRDISDRILWATLPPRPGTSYALDESGIWAWAKGRKSSRTKSNSEATTEAVSVCPDAAWGTKTGKNGQQDTYFGYGLHALVRIPDLRQGPSFTDVDDPILIEAIELTPASTDIVEVSLNLIDRVRERQQVRDLAADRHYSYKEWSRWAHELWKRGIHPVLDLREDEHGFRDFNGARLAASWPHCPATPTRLGTIPRPGPTATKADKAVFERNIAERQTYAMRRVKGHVPDGASRWECPARAGKLGCPLVEGTVDAARQLQLRVVAKPPAGADKPACCTQRTFMLRVEPPQADDVPRERERKKRLAQAMKHAQDEYWGDQRWQVSFNRRTHVEGAFGNLKNPNTENLHRGLFRFTGLPLVTLALSAAAAACNVRQLRNWHERTGNGDLDHPLLQPEPEFGGFVLIPVPRMAPPLEPDVPEAA